MIRRPLPEREDGLFWSEARLDLALAHILAGGADGGGLTARPRRSGIGDSPSEVIRWLQTASRRSGFEATAAYTDSVGLSAALVVGGPCLVLWQTRDGALSAAALAHSDDRHCRIIRGDGDEQEMTRDELHALLAAQNATHLSLAHLFAGLPRGAEAHRALLETGLAAESWFCVIRFTLAASQRLWSQLAAVGFRRHLAGFLGVAFAQMVVAAAAAWTLGDAAVTGLIDLGRVGAWSVLAASNIPLQYVSATILGRLTRDFAKVVKKRLLEGTFHIEETAVRRRGLGALLARLSESEIIEQTSVTELAGALTPIAQLIAALVLLAKGASAGVFVCLYGVFLLASIGLVAIIARRYRAFYSERINLTEDLVSKILGYRTRAVQADSRNLHEPEDEALRHYTETSRSYDAAVAISAVFGRGWLFATTIGLLVAFIWGATTRELIPSAIAIVLAYRAFTGLFDFANSLARWLNAWNGVRPLLEAGRHDGKAAADGSWEPGLDTIVSSVGFAYGDRAHRVLTNASLQIKPGDRVLIQGPSGGGKTTLSKLLTGELRPSSGTILVEGVDRDSVSELEWRRHVGASPQFHENYLFTNTLGFNVDPRSVRPELSAAAMDVCRELGLDELLRKMPAGPAQILGETGWQLSHGERSRVFIARSLLQGASILIFDESFSALDPESLTRAFECVRKRAPTLVVIAHP